MPLGNEFSVFLNQTGNQPLYGDTLNDSSKKINGLLWSALGQSSQPQTGGGVASSSPSALPVQIDRIDWGLQNLGTTPLYVLLGDGASATNFDFILNGGAVANDGLGGSAGVANYKGSVSVYSATTPSYKVWAL